MSTIKFSIKSELFTSGYDKYTMGYCVGILFVYIFMTRLLAYVFLLKIKD